MKGLPRALADLSLSATEDRSWILTQLTADERQRLSRWLDTERSVAPSQAPPSAGEVIVSTEERLRAATPRVLATALANEPTWLVHCILAQLDVIRHPQVLALLPSALRSALLAMSFAPVSIAPALRETVNETFVNELVRTRGGSGGRTGSTDQPSRFDQLLERFKAVKR